MLLAISVVISGMSSIGCDKPESTQIDEKILPHVRVAEVRMIAPRPRSEHLAPLQAHRRARLSPRTGGQVLVLNADEEQEVKRGTTLVRFAAQDSKGGLMSAKASIAQIEESLRDNARELEDARDLVGKGAGTTREVERLETQTATLNAQLRSAKGTLVQAKDRLGASTIEAPFDGTITAVRTEVGEFVAPGVVALVLAELDPISIEVPLTQSEVEIYDAQGLEFLVKARGTTATAEIDYVSSESADGSTFTARLDIANPGHKLRDGELVDVEVFGKAQAQVKSVPFTAVRWAADEAYVLVVNEDDTLSRIAIEVVDESDENVIIESDDVQAGVRVVQTGPTALRQDDRVEVVAAPSDTLAAG